LGSNKKAMIPYETLTVIIKGDNPVEQKHYTAGDSVAHGVKVEFDLVFSDPDRFPWFVVKVDTHQKLVSNDMIIHGLKTETIFQINSNFQEFINEKFDFFERLIFQAYCHCQGLSIMAFGAAGFEIKPLPDMSFFDREAEFKDKRTVFIAHAN
jgi:hypothetical protein